MMKKFLTIFTLSLITCLSLHAQDPVCIPGEINPDTAIILPEPYNAVDMDGGLDSTCVGLFYEQVMTALVPSTIPFGGIDITIDSISIDLEGAIVGLPPGLDYACNPPSCVFLPDSSACFVITGTVDPEATPMTYDLELTLRAFNFIFPLGGEINFPQDLGNADESYFIHVQSEAECEFLVSTSELANTLKASLFPNPASDFVQLKIASEESKDVNVMIVDVLGRVYKEQDASLVTGENTIDMELNGISQGIYFMTITDGKDFLSQKIIIE